MTSQPGYQAIAIHILPHISQSKNNQTMKFGRVIAYNKKNIMQNILQGFSKILQKLRQGD